LSRDRKSRTEKTETADIMPVNGYPMSASVLQVVLDNSYSAIAVLGDNHKIEYVNKAAIELFGGSRENIVDHDFREILNDEFAAIMSERYELRRAGKEVPSTYPFEITRPDGESVVVEGRMSLVKAPDGSLKTVVHVLDITTAEAGKALLAEQQQRYKILVETMNDGLAIDDVDGNLTYANQAFQRMLGYTLDELVGKPWISFVSDLDTQGLQQKIEDRKQGISEKYELTWKSKTGEEVPTIVSATPLQDSDGNFEGTFGIVTEISAQKNAEETIQFYLDLLSHDIANQLQVIMTSSGLLEEEVPPVYVTEARKDIIDAVGRCNRLITKVKRVSQIRHAPISNMEITSVLKEKLLILERVYDAKVHTSGLDKMTYVKADALLGELVWNLLENACRHNPKDKKEVWVEGKSKRGIFELSISDDGPGLSDARKKTLFSGKKHSGGVGLRLVSQMVRKYGGSIEVLDRVKGKPSFGCTFVVRLLKVKRAK